MPEGLAEIATDSIAGEASQAPVSGAPVSELSTSSTTAKSAASALSEICTRTVAAAFRIGIQLSAPFLVFGLLFNLGLGVLARLMPQMQVFFVGMPLSILAGFLILFLVLAAMMGTYLDSIETVLRELAPHAGQVN